MKKGIEEGGNRAASQLLSLAHPGTSRNRTEYMQALSRLRNYRNKKERSIIWLPRFFLALKKEKRGAKFCTFKRRVITGESKNWRGEKWGRAKKDMAWSQPSQSSWIPVSGNVYKMNSPFQTGRKRGDWERQRLEFFFWRSLSGPKNKDWTTVTKKKVSKKFRGELF